MIKKEKELFILETEHTSYLFRIMPQGHLEHVYYGEKIPVLGTVQALYEKRAFAPGNTITYDREHPNLALENVSLELSCHGNGDIRVPFVAMEDEQGNEIGDFLYDSSEITSGKEAFCTLPGSYDERGQVMQLKITLKSRSRDVLLQLFYWVYEDCDVISRSVTVVNQSTEAVFIRSLMSMQLDLAGSGYMVHSFHGAWAREMNRYETPVHAGRFEISSHTGTSSNRANPFFMVAKKETTEEDGTCMGFNLIYSGDHCASVEVNSYGKTRIVTGISPESFGWKLEKGQQFEAPEAVLTFSAGGYGQLSRNMHAFVNEHIVRGAWKKKERPILLNSWEACYFDISEKRLLNLAKKAKEAGIELFVMDDGWFGGRNDDTSSLGDWYVNREKLPSGLDGLARKINALGLDFGIWVEPEMVSENSECFRQHPDWVLGASGTKQSMGRNQMILDLGQQQVQEYILSCMKNILNSANISYVKWDMNRIFSDVSCNWLEAGRKREIRHRYMIGLYRVLKELTEAFPKVLFEGCASGGNRFDLGMLCFMPQIWASDNTDALCRSVIQQGYSYGYPLSTLGCHVSGIPNHQTLRRTPLASRFHVACFGVLGYECNLAELKKEELEEIKQQTALYKKWRSVFQFGTFYRLPVPYSDGADNGCQWMCVSEDRGQAVGMLFQEHAVANGGALKFTGRGLLEDAQYHFHNIPKKENILEFGDLVNLVSPIHIKQNSLMHKAAAKVVKLDGEKEDWHVSGTMICKAGIALRQSYGGTGYNEEVRYYPDYGSRMYFMEKE